MSLSEPGSPARPTPYEAAAQLAGAPTLTASPADLRVHAFTTVAGGFLLALVAVAATALYDRPLAAVPAVAALLVAIGALEWWSHRAGRVATRAATRYRAWGRALTVVVALSLAGRVGVPLVLVLATLPSLVAAGLTLRRGDR